MVCEMHVTFSEGTNINYEVLSNEMQQYPVCTVDQKRFS